MAKKKGTVKVKSYNRVGDTQLDKLAYEVAGFKSKRVKAHDQKLHKQKKEQK